MKHLRPVAAGGPEIPSFYSRQKVVLKAPGEKILLKKRNN